MSYKYVKITTNSIFSTVGGYHWLKKIGIKNNKEKYDPEFTDVQVGTIGKILGNEGSIYCVEIPNRYIIIYNDCFEILGVEL